MKIRVYKYILRVTILFLYREKKKVNSMAVDCSEKIILIKLVLRKVLSNAQSNVGVVERGTSLMDKR